jgi:uncharacterized protein (DUF362 family)
MQVPQACLGLIQNQFPASRWHAEAAAAAFRNRLAELTGETDPSLMILSAQFSIPTD